MLETDRIGYLFADARELYQDAREMLEQGRLRNAAEKAWVATKRATDALILARTGVKYKAASTPSILEIWDVTIAEAKREGMGYN